MIKIKAYFIFLMLFILFSPFGCGNQSLRSKVRFPDYLPEGLIIRNYKDADIVVAISIDKTELSLEESIYSDSGKIGYAMLVYNGNVFHSYKGNLEKGTISFKHLQEYEEGLIERVNEERTSKIVFLKRGNKKGEYVASQFTVFSYTEELHLALIEYSKNQ